MPMSTACQVGHAPGEVANRNRSVGPPAAASAGSRRGRLRATAEVVVSSGLGHVGSSAGSAQFAFSAVSTLISTRRFLVWLSGSTGRSQPTPSTLNRLGSRSLYFCRRASLMALARLSDSSLTGLDGHLAPHRRVGVPFDDDPRAPNWPASWRPLRARFRRWDRTAPRRLAIHRPVRRSCHRVRSCWGRSGSRSCW